MTLASDGVQILPTLSMKEPNFLPQDTHTTTTTPESLPDFLWRTLNIGTELGVLGSSCLHTFSATGLSLSYTHLLK